MTEQQPIIREEGPVRDAAQALLRIPKDRRWNEVPEEWQARIAELTEANAAQFMADAKALPPFEEIRVMAGLRHAGKLGELVHAWAPEAFADYTKRNAGFVF